MPYDETLLEKARTQWQFGDWDSLAQLNREQIQHHPDRAKLALLGAAGRLQRGTDAEARQFVRLAQDWGVSKKLISQILIAGVHNSIGRAAAIGNQAQRALQHFESAITIGAPGSDAKLLTQARMGEQLHQLGLPTPEGFLKVGAGETAVSAPAIRISAAPSQLPDDIHQAWLTGQWAHPAQNPHRPASAPTLLPGRDRKTDRVQSRRQHDHLSQPVPDAWRLRPPYVRPRR